MKDLLLRVRCWISWHTMPKNVRPLFLKAVHELAGDLEKLLKELCEEQRKGEE